jgi:hypothetical protein
MTDCSKSKRSGINLLETERFDFSACALLARLTISRRAKGFLFKDSQFIVEDEVAATSGVSFSTGAKVA